MSHYIDEIIENKIDAYLKNNDYQNIKDLINFFYNIEESTKEESFQLEKKVMIINMITKNIRRKDRLNCIKDIYLNDDFKDKILNNKEKELDDSLDFLVNKIKPARIVFLFKKISNPVEKQAFQNLLGNYIKKNGCEKYINSFWDVDLKKINCLYINDENVFENIINYVVKNKNKKLMIKILEEIHHEVCSKLISKENLNNIIKIQEVFKQNDIDFIKEIKKFSSFFEYKNLLDIKIKDFQDPIEKEITLKNYLKTIIDNVSSSEELITIPLFREINKDLIEPLIELIYIHKYNDMKKILENVNNNEKDKEHKYYINKLFSDLEKKTISSHIEPLSKESYRKRM